jgi:hypothetical protein
MPYAMVRFKDTGGCLILVRYAVQICICNYSIPLHCSIFSGKSYSHDRKEDSIVKISDIIFGIIHSSAHLSNL